MSDSDPVCLNCGASLYGDWCHACGQKLMADEHRRLSWLIGQLVGKITSFEGKLPRSLIALVARPGRLGAAWLAGQRVRWASPFSLFLVVNLLYFLAPPVTDFHLPLSDQLGGQVYSGWARERVEVRFPGFSDWRASVPDASIPDGFRKFEADFNQRSEGLSKTLLILQVPPMAVALLLLYRRRRVYFVDHFVVALHFWTFLLFALMVLPRLSTWVSGGLYSMGLASSPTTGEAFWKIGMLVWVVGHLVCALRSAYGEGWGRSVLKAVPAFLACGVAHFVYRAALFAVTLWVL